MSIPPAPPPNPAGGFALEDVIEILERRWWWLLIGAVLGTAIGVAVYLVLPPVYTADTTILVEPQEVPKSYIRPTVTVAVRERLRTLQERVTSFSNLNELIDRIGAERLDPSGELSREQIMNMIRDGLDVQLGTRRAKTVNVFQVSFTHHDPTVAADVVRELAALFIAENLKDRARQAAATAEFLDRELERLRAQVTANERRIREFKQKRFGELPTQLDANLRALDRLNYQLTANLEAQESIAQRIALLRQQMAAQAGGGTSTPAALAQILRDLRAKLVRAEMVYTDEHPTVQHLRDEIARIEKRIEEAAQQPSSESPNPAPLDRAFEPEIQRAQLELERRKREEKRLREQIATLERRVEETPRVEQEFKDLTRDYKNLLTSYHKLLSKKLEAQLARNLEQEQKGERFKVLRPARAPSSPAWPDWRLFVPGGLAGGLALVVGLIALAELRNPTFRSVSRLVRTLGLPVVTSVPRIEDDRLFDKEPPEGVDRRLVVFTAPESAPAEQYRGFVPLLLERPDARVILVTSAARGDGKSLTCMNLACTVACDLGRRVLVIDGDLRRPTAHRLVGVPRRKGLTDVLGGDAALEECARNSKIPNVTVLPAGTTARTPLALLTGEAFLKLIERVRSLYDVVFIDAPPLLPVVDARVLKRMADLVIFVVRADTTPRDAVIRSLREIRDVAGVVFNEVSTGSYRRYYYDDAYSRYAYGEPTLDDPAAQGAEDG